MPTALVVVASTRAAAGTYEDRSGPIAVEFLRGLGLDCPDAVVVSDAEVKRVVDKLLSSSDRPDVLLTSGGTGLSADDATVEAVRAHLDRELPGVVHAFWNKGLEQTPMAVLSRAVAGVVGTTFVMTLPGSRGGVRDGCAVLEPLLPHILEQLGGSHEH